MYKNCMQTLCLAIVRFSMHFYVSQNCSFATKRSADQTKATIGSHATVGYPSLYVSKYNNLKLNYYYAGSWNFTFEINLINV